MDVVERYEAPETLQEAIELLASGDALVFAGGTDVMPQIRTGSRQLRPILINISRITDLRGISRDGTRLRIGALTTVTDILESALLKETAPVLVAAADRFASGQVRNAATVGGNLGNASPAADLAIPLLLLDAEVELFSRKRRVVPLTDFFLGPGRSVLEPGEILTHVQFEVPRNDFTARFVKFGGGTRPAMDISVVSVGVAGVVAGRALSRVRVALGAAAPTPLRATKTEAFLEGKGLDRETIAAAAAMAETEASPISDVRGSAWYRRELIRTLTRRVLADVV